jgi:CRP-like cAMP-binding protein
VKRVEPAKQQRERGALKVLIDESESRTRSPLGDLGEVLAQSNGKQPFRNSILRSLPLIDFAVLRPSLQPVVLKERAVLQEPTKRIEYVNFIETGIVSLRTLSPGSILETAMVGSQGAVGASVVLGPKVSMHQSVVLVASTALRIHVNDLERSMFERPRIREHLLHHVQALMIHSSQTALCGVRHELESRLASWLCLACDSLGGFVLPITHDHLSMLLGLRLAGVTETLAKFEEAGMIRKMRGVLEVCDRKRLEQEACGCYQIIAKSYHC